MSPTPRTDAVAKRIGYLAAEYKTSGMDALTFANKATDALNELSELERERDELIRWKAEALLVESRWDCQRVGKLLGMTLGHDIRPNIEPKIRALIEARHQVEMKLSDALVENAHLKEALAAGDCKDSAADVEILRDELVRLRDFVVDVYQAEKINAVLKAIE